MCSSADRAICRMCSFVLHPGTWQAKRVTMFLASHLPCVISQGRRFPRCYLPLPGEESCCELTAGAGQASSSGGRISSPTFKAELWKDLRSSGFPLWLDWSSLADGLQLLKCVLLPWEGWRWLAGGDTQPGHRPCPTKCICSFPGWCQSSLKKH